MESSRPVQPPTPLEGRLGFGVFLLCLAFNFWGLHVGWESRNLPANEFREAQTALSAYWIKEEGNFSLAYPTPVVGKPWSIPLEYPLYQWTVVVTGKVTGWGLTKAGRAVSIACFYLTLPAVFLLLARWYVRPAHRWLVLAVMLTCPFYIFHARAFLMETMALMFGLWFWVVFERAVAERRQRWLALAVLMGTGAGLVKVTTFILFLLPAVWWTVRQLWRARNTTWKADVLWMATAVALPFGATLWWLDFADETKSLNELGAAFTSENVSDFIFGTMETRFSPELWATKARIVIEQLTWWPVLLLCALLAFLTGRARWRELTSSVVWFTAVLVIFPELYAYHDYYYAANTVFLMVAMGLAVVALAESAAPRWLTGLAVATVLGGQAWRYVDHYYPVQSAISPGGNGLTSALRTVTNPEDVIVVLGQDWNSMLPYYAQRRALMFRDEPARDGDKVERALAALEGHTLGALVIAGQPDGRQWLIDRASVRGLAREPLMVWRDVQVYLPQARQAELLTALLENDFHEVRLAPGVELPPANLGGKWFEMAAVHRWQRKPFVGLQPQPVRFFSSFGPAMDGSSGQPMFGAHPVTRLVFALPAGPHVLRSSLQMALDAYRLDLQETEATDGVEVSLFVLGAKGERRQVATRHFDPRHDREDRGTLRPLEFTFTLPEAGEVELFFGPGPAGKDTRDWIQLGPLKIE